MTMFGPFRGDRWAWLGLALVASLPLISRGTMRLSDDPMLRFFVGVPLFAALFALGMVMMNRRPPFSGED